MDRKRAIYAYQMAVIIPLVIITAINMFTGVAVVTTPLGLVGTIGLMLACLLGVHFSMKRKVNDSMDKYVDMYNQKCDPEAFLEAGGTMAYNMLSAREKGDDLGELDAWYLSLYALACLDMGQTDHAERIATAVLEDVSKQKAAITQASMLVNIEPLVLRMRGADEALSVISKIDALIMGDNSSQAQGIRNYMEFERKVLRGIVDDDRESVLDMFEKVYHSSYQPMRLRVLAADTAASIYRSVGNENDELIALTFVEEHGNKLPVVPAAVARAAELF